MYKEVSGREKTGVGKYDSSVPLCIYSQYTSDVFIASLATVNSMFISCRGGRARDAAAPSDCLDTAEQP